MDARTAGPAVWLRRWVLTPTGDQYSCPSPAYPPSDMDAAARAAIHRPPKLNGHVLTALGRRMEDKC